MIKPEATSYSGKLYSLRYYYIVKDVFWLAFLPFVGRPFSLRRARSFSTVKDWKSFSLVPLLDPSVQKKKKKNIIIKWAVNSPKLESDRDDLTLSRYISRSFSWASVVQSLICRPSILRESKRWTNHFCSEWTILFNRGEV